MATSFLNINAHLPTGSVNITLDNGEPSYEIRDQCAYDEISLTHPIDTEHPDGAVLYHGTLALRYNPNRAVLAELAKNRKVRRFVDVNLRDPWWNSHYILETLDYAYFVKLNIHEMQRLLEAGGQAGDSDSDWLELSLSFKNRHNIVQLLITRGEEGATLIDSAGEIHQVAPAGSHVEIKDAVGAGDAFAAVMLLGLVNHWEFSVTLDRAQAFASYIVGQRGAISKNQATYRDFRHLWHIKTGHI